MCVITYRVTFICISTCRVTFVCVLSTYRVTFVCVSTCRGTCVCLDTYNTDALNQIKFNDGKYKTTGSLGITY